VRVIAERVTTPLFRFLTHVPGAMDSQNVPSRQQTAAGRGVCRESDDCGSAAGGYEDVPLGSLAATLWNVAFALVPIA
jgi:hypothetical protein